MSYRSFKKNVLSKKAPQIEVPTILLYNNKL